MTQAQYMAIDRLMHAAGRAERLLWAMDSRRNRMPQRDKIPCRDASEQLSAAIKAWLDTQESVTCSDSE